MTADRKLRVWVYRQRPAHYGVAGCACGNDDPDWSEFEGHLWCAECQIDFIPKHSGVFDGPILVGCAEILGYDFSRILLPSTTASTAYPHVDMTLRDNVLRVYAASLPDRVMGFFSEHRPLSNFHIESFNWDGCNWTSSEAAYQAAKAGSEHYARFAAMAPNDAKRAGQTVQVNIIEWHARKRTVMADILRAKFQQCAHARKVLLDTGDAHLEECNWWKDVYWGTYLGNGQNTLGELLMGLRAILRSPPIDPKRLKCPVCGAVGFGCRCAYGSEHGDIE